MIETVSYITLKKCISLRVPPPIHKTLAVQNHFVLPISTMVNSNKPYQNVMPIFLNMFFYKTKCPNKIFRSSANVFLYKHNIRLQLKYYISVLYKKKLKATLSGKRNHCEKLPWLCSPVRFNGIHCSCKGVGKYFFI